MSNPPRYHSASSGITVIRVTALHKISNAEAEDLLSSFLGHVSDRPASAAATVVSAVTANTVPAAVTSPDTASATGSTGKVAALSTAVTQQLQRIRRDLLGLGPVFVSRKRKLQAVVDDETGGAATYGENGEDAAMQDGDVSIYAADDAAVSSSGIDKAERKRRKRERQKEAKRQKNTA
ncbi:uncharacterized protein V1518DRAFT_410854 [Limtongia smithiae]|uniref:uncharacterized protein n=1 Tax=Limtongia smithiae TaxID=1125753 RepID=UPI0034CF4529